MDTKYKKPMDEGESSKNYNKKYYKKFKEQLNEIEKKNNCDYKEKRKIHPSIKMQKELIEYYESKNRNFKEARKQAKENMDNENRVLDRIEPKLRVEFIRGLLGLYKFGEVGFIELGFGRFLKKVLTIHKICTYNPSINKVFNK
uniref:Uncharacterized protein n=1 Tax=Meloidogyne hapla TaxID=6305 RepID=A0A1I8BFE4_MELHA